MFDKTAPLNEWSAIYRAGNAVTETKQGLNPYQKGNDPTVGHFMHNNFDVICYIHPSDEQFSQLAYFRNAKEFCTQKISHQKVSSYKNEQYFADFGVGFWIKVPMYCAVPVSYIIQSIHAMLKPYISNRECKYALPYTLVMYHRLHYRFPWKDCKYPAAGGNVGRGCQGCDLTEYAIEYGTITFTSSDLRCFGLFAIVSDAI